MNWLKNNITKNHILKAIFVLAILLSCLVPSLSFISEMPMISLISKVLFAVIIIFATLFVLFKTKTNVPFIILLIEILYLILGVIAITINGLQVEQMFWNLGSLFGIVCVLNLALLSRRTIDLKTAYLVGLFFLLFSFIACIYSDIAESSSIINAFLAKGEESHFYQIHSFFESKNAYGFVLFASLSLILLMLRKTSKVSLFLIPFYIFFFINLVFSRCKIALIASLVLLFIKLVYFAVDCFKKNRNITIVITCTIVILLIAALSLICVPQIYQHSSLLSKLNNYLVEGFFGQAYRSFNTRLEQLNLVLALFNSPRIIIGYGERVYSVILNNVVYSTNIDNAYFSTILSGGIVKAIFLLILIFLSTKYILRLKEIDKRFMTFMFGMLFVYLLYGMFEGYSAIGASFYSIVWLIFLILLPKIYANYYNLKSKPNIALHITGSFLKGGTEAFILNYLSEIQSHQQYIFDIYCFGQADDDKRKQIEDAGGKIFFGPSPSKRQLIKALLSFNNFLFTHREYDVIHCSANFDNFIYLHVANLYDLSIRIEHGHDTLTGIQFSKINKLINAGKRICNNYNSNKVFACSAEAGRDIVGAKYFDKHGMIIPNSINYKKFLNVSQDKVKAIIDKYNLKNKKVFGNISRFEEKKNQQFIIKLFESYHKNNKNSVLILGGVDGGKQSEIQSLVSSMSCSNAVVFIGPRNDVELWLNIFDVYMMPSLFEGFGISAIEAQISGSFVLASNNLPKLSDVGVHRISYLSLDDEKSWLKAMDEEGRVEKLDLKNAKYNIENDYKILLTEYGISVN